MNWRFEALLLEVSFVPGSEHRLKRSTFSRHLQQKFPNEDPFTILEAVRVCQRSKIHPEGTKRNSAPLSKIGKNVEATRVRVAEMPKLRRRR
jgi:hypothetical protein